MIEADALDNLSSQNIYEKLLNTDGFESLNPSHIIQKISEYNQSQFEDDNINMAELFSNLDKFSNDVGNDVKKLDSILDDILNNEEINNVIFDNDHKNIYELEFTPTIDILDNYINNEKLTDEEILRQLKSIDKKIGSNLQKTIMVYDLYNTNSLLFKDESTELSELIINKLCTFIEIIIDFSKIKDISDSFLRGAFDEICKFLSPKEILQKINIINIDEEIYVKIFKDIVPNAFKYWSTNSNQNIDFEKLELLKQLDPDSELILDSPDRLTAKTIPFERINARSLGNKREKKLRYPIWFVERVTEEVISEYNIDNIILKFIDSKVNINWKEVEDNCKLKDNTFYKYQIDPEIFEDVFQFTEVILLDACDLYLKKLKGEIDILNMEINNIKIHIPKKLLQAGGVCFQNLYLDDKAFAQLPPIVKIKLRQLEELEFKLLDLEHKYIIKEDILRNVFEIIGFSCYRSGLDKVKLITYHYICRYLEELTIPFKLDKNIYKVRGFVVPLEVFRYDLLRLLCHDDTMKKFIFTMKELVMKWVIKYTLGSRLAQFYFDILMVTPDILTEQILRIIALSIIKNKNPMTLRAIYSSYISLVHLIIDSNINFTDLSKKKYGNFSNVNNMIDGTDVSNNRMLVPSKFQDNYQDTVLLRLWLYKNPKKLNKNYYLLKRLNFHTFLELDPLRLMATKPKDIGILDWSWYYTNYFQFIEKEENIVYKIKTKYLKSDRKNAQLKFIEIMVGDLLSDKLREKLYDSEIVNEIVGVIAEDISMRTINRGYLDSNYNLIVKSNQDYLDYIYQSLIDIKNSL